MIQIGDRLPEGQLVEYIESEGGKFGPKLFNVGASVKGKRIAILAVSGPYVPARRPQVDAYKQAGVEEIWCAGITDPHAMASWSRELKAVGKVRMVGDGSGIYLRSLGLEVSYGMLAPAGRTRTSILLDDGIVKQVNLEAAARVEASNDNQALAPAA